MEDKEHVKFIFDIGKATKQFYETPVLLITLKDYSHYIFNTMCSLRDALQKGSQKEISDIIIDFHLQWMYAINEVQSFTKRVNDISKQEVFEAISYTIDAMHKRLKYYISYAETRKHDLNKWQQLNLNADVEIIEEMHKEVVSKLLKKLKCFQNYYDDEEISKKLKEAIEELMLWIDKMNDNFVLMLCKYFKDNAPHLSTDLTKILQHIVNDMQTAATPSAQKLLEETGKEMSPMIQGTTSYNLEMSKVLEKISQLDDRIARLQNEPTSAAVMALTHKKEYLEYRLASLENLKTSLKNLQESAGANLEELDNTCSCEDFYTFKIFNHFLPMEERERLVTELCYLWDSAVYGSHSRKSIVSIMSAAENKEEFTDEHGKFYIDEYSRKIYKLPDDETLYQPNELNELVCVTDDSEHVYFYDECGRYFIDSKTRGRVYKAHAAASEYMMDSSGVLFKTKEVRDGVVYYFDNFGRYYINEKGINIYREPDTVSEYENDGVGNLVRKRTCIDNFEPCPDDVRVSEDFKYLKNNVGPALRASIALCILHQPDDPVKYLSFCLLKYRENLEIKDKRARDYEALLAERLIVEAAEREKAEAAEREAALLAQGGSECSYDSNLIHYGSDIQG